MDAKRRLPLLQATPPEREEELTRGRWAWVGFGVLAIFVVWLPLSAAWLALASRLAPGELERRGSAPFFSLAVAGGALGALAVASFAGGALLGRWGGRGVGVRGAAIAGGAAALIAIGGSWISFGVAAGALVIVPAGVLMAALGGRFGTARRNASR